MKKRPVFNAFFSRIDPFVLIAGLLIFGSIEALGVQRDSAVQVQFLFKFLSVGAFPIPPGFYALVAIFYGSMHVIGLRAFLGDQISLGIIVTLITGIAWFAKYHITKQTLRSIADNQLASPITITVLSVTLLFTAPVFYDVQMHLFYLGRIATHAWQNPTSILVMPFVLLLFNESLSFLNTTKTAKRNVLAMFSWGMVCILIKPSFLFAFIPSFVLLSIFRFGFSTKARIAVFVSLTLFMGILFEAFLIYYLDLYSIFYEGDSKSVVFAPFRFLSSFGGNVLLNIFVSILFPLCYLILSPNELKKKVEVQFAYLVFFFALLVGVLFEESGATANNGNFMWQAIMANYVLFCVVASSAFLHEPKGKFERRRKLFLLAVYSLHVISGIAYIINYLVTGLYL